MTYTGGTLPFLVHVCFYICLGAGLCAVELFLLFFPLLITNRGCQKKNEALNCWHGVTDSMALRSVVSANRPTTPRR